MDTTPGYSGKSLAEKLGISEGGAVLVVNPPEDYGDWLGPKVQTTKAGVYEVPFTALFVHLFVTEVGELEQALKLLRTSVNNELTVWVSWPKKSSGLNSDVGEQTIRDIGLPMGWVDIKVCAVSDIWSGLKLVVRKELRQKSR